MVASQWFPLQAVNPLTATLRANNQLGLINDYIVYDGCEAVDVLKQFDLEWLLGRNEDWGSLYVNAGEKGWQGLLTDVA